jgi:triosephosphate isomerase
MRRPTIIAGNWKMNMTLSNGKLLIESLVAEHPSPDPRIIIIPPFTHIDMAHTLLKDTPLLLGAQTLSHYDNGAYTGDISAEMLRDIGCQYVLIGHSERRQYHGEDDTLLNQKMKQAIAHHITPIYCVGETLEDRNSNRTLSVIDRQLEVGLSDISLDKASFIIAYEPVWAIGTGQVATPDQAQTVHAHIRHKLIQLSDQSVADTCPILYGGSVNPGNSKKLLSQPDIDGGLVGGASLDNDAFGAIIGSCTS